VTYANEIYIGSVALEPNRWKKGQEPSFRVSDWIALFMEAGFDGIELWQNHALKADDAELARLQSSVVPVKIFNSYVNFSSDGAEDRARVAEMVTELGCDGVKFNFGKNGGDLSSYKSHFGSWLNQLPPDCRILCECHAGTVLEEPHDAHRILSSFKDDRIEIIFHGPPENPAALDPWFDLFSEKMTHMHMQTRTGRYDRNSELWAERFLALKKLGFAGSWSIEFTEGSGSKEETPDMVWANARSDLKFARAQQ
jgi:sugar phosphate isomerase/epimerase